MGWHECVHFLLGNKTQLTASANNIRIFHILIWLALLSRRVAVMPPFIASHIGLSEPNLPFGEVFDIPRLSSAIGIGIIEWRDLKLPVAATDEPEEIGCWSTFMPHHNGEHLHSAMEDYLGLGMLYNHHVVPWSFN
jgi:hypothetical protein